MMCSPFLQWSPNLSEITCTAACEQGYIQDGICNDSNNNEECEYDGGDCCDPASCGDEDCSKCKDVTSPFIASGDHLPST